MAKNLLAIGHNLNSVERKWSLWFYDPDTYRKVYAQRDVEIRDIILLDGQMVLSKALQAVEARRTEAEKLSSSQLEVIGLLIEKLKGAGYG